MNREQKIEAVKDYCVDELREVQTDNLDFGEDENGKSQGSIYWVEGATTWLYYCNGKSEYGECDDLLHGIKKKILLSYYESNKDEIDEFVEYPNELNKKTEEMINKGNYEKNI